MTEAATLLQALAALLQAAAWPGVAVYALVKYRNEIAALLKRVRKAAGVDLDPPIQEKPADTLQQLPPPPLPRTPTTIFWEGQLKQLPLLATTTTPAEREQLLITLAARTFVIAQFEHVEGNIWASQMRLLEHVNLHPAGAPLPELKQLFYDPAAAAFPENFAHYPFEQYLTFLTGRGLITIAGDRATITDAGREYLQWRIEQRRAPKIAG